MFLWMRFFFFYSVHLSSATLAFLCPIAHRAEEEERFAVLSSLFLSLASVLSRLAGLNLQCPLIFRLSLVNSIGLFHLSYRKRKRVSVFNSDVLNHHGGAFYIEHHDVTEQCTCFESFMMHMFHFFTTPLTCVSLPVCLSSKSILSSCSRDKYYNLGHSVQLHPFYSSSQRQKHKWRDKKKKRP